MSGSQDAQKNSAISNLKKVKRGTNSDLEVMALIIEENQGLKNKILDIIRRARSERIAFGKDSALTAKNSDKKNDDEKNK